MIKVLVADDHPVVRDGLRALFAEYPNIDVIGEAATGREAIKAAVIDKPDVIIMDLAMPDTDGFSATAEISRVAPDVAVLVLTMSDDDSTVTKAMRAGARGYLLKGATKEEILRAVTAVADGQAIFGPAVAQRVLARLGAPSTDEDPFPSTDPTGARRIEAACTGLVELCDRRSSGPLTEDGEQQHLLDLHQAQRRAAVQKRRSSPATAASAAPDTPQRPFRITSR